MQLKVASPILGFEKIESFQLDQIDDFFYRLHSGDIAFTLIEPGKLRSYTFDLPPFYARKLQAQQGDDLLVLAIMIVQDPIEDSVINFRAPIVINRESGLLVQVPLDEQHYPDFSLAEKIGRYL